MDCGLLRRAADRVSPLARLAWLEEGAFVVFVVIESVNR